MSTWSNCMDNERVFPRDSIIDLDQIRAAAREFLTSRGAKPASATWQRDD